jgi:uncharacterized protein
MKVRLHELPVRRTIDLPSEFVRAAVSGLPIRAALERPEDDAQAGEAHADLELTAEGASVFARGSIEGWVEVACSRCIGPVRVPIRERVHVTFLPRNQVPHDFDLEDDDEFEIEPTEDDLDLYPYDAEEVDLEPLLREQVILAIPFAPLCRDDCKGLCVKCGTDLNQQSCGCERNVVDPRLGPLKDLKV